MSTTSTVPVGPTYPNRESLSGRATRVAVVLALLVSAGIVALIAVRGWGLMQEARTYAAAFAVANVLFVVQVLRWSRGVLPMAAGAAALLVLFAGASIGSWYERAASGYAEASVAAEIARLVTVACGVQVVVVVISIVAFGQRWHEEVEAAPAARRGEVVES